MCRGKTKWTAQWKYIMPNGEIRTHFDASPSYLADGTVLFNAVILDVTKKPLMRQSSIPMNLKDQTRN
jgi:hypothetical protein